MSPAQYLPLIAAILLVDLLALVSPGPNAVLVTSAAMSGTRRHAVATGLGVAAGSLFWATAAAFGMSAVFDALPRLALLLKAAGAIYLIHLGIRLLRSDGIDPAAVGAAPPHRPARGFLRGLTVNLTNPKSLAYYASVFAALLAPGLPPWVLAVLIGGITTMSVLWHGLLALIFSAPRIRTRYAAISRHVDRACGAVLVALGLKLAWDLR